MKHILILISILFFTSCGTVKKIENSNRETTATEKTEVKKDSSTVLEKNGAIEDNIKILVPKVNTQDEDFNEKCTQIIDQLLNQINTQKKSGNNNYSLYYNLEKRLLELQVQIAETQNTTTETNKEEITEQSYTEKTDEYISKKVSQIPFWFYIIIAFWFLPQILERLSIFNPIVSKLLKK